MGIIEKVSFINELRAFVKVQGEQAEKLADRAVAVGLEPFSVSLKAMAGACQAMVTFIDDVEKKLSRFL